MEQPPVSLTSTGVPDPSPTSSVPSKLLIRCEQAGIVIRASLTPLSGSKRQIVRPCWPFRQETQISAEPSGTQNSWVQLSPGACALTLRTLLPSSLTSHMRASTRSCGPSWQKATVWSSKGRQIGCPSQIFSSWITWLSPLCRSTRSRRQCGPL